MKELTDIVEIEPPERIVNSIKDVLSRETHLINNRTIVDGRDSSSFSLVDREV